MRPRDLQYGYDWVAWNPTWLGCAKGRIPNGMGDVFGNDQVLFGLWVGLFARRSSKRLKDTVWAWSRAAIVCPHRELA
ncbi:MAG: hypothetical protein WA655_11265 [Candidatus Korobacteraceae bacterium]